MYWRGVALWGMGLAAISVLMSQLMNSDQLEAAASV
jgi:hypothetical protein